MRLREAIAAHERGELILPRVLECAESSAAESPRGSVLVASLRGDVHAIGRALLVTILSGCGYTVHDLGKQVAVDEVVDATLRLRPDAVALTALLVTTSRQMPACVQALDAHGAQVPVLIGGAAITRAFGRHSATLPDGRIYAPGVFYCRDVFEGLATLDALTDPPRRAGLLEHARAEIEAERHPTLDPPTESPVVASHLLALARAPTPRHWGVLQFKPGLDEVWKHLDTNTLFRFHWGGYRAKDPSSLRFEPLLAELQASAHDDGWLQAQVVSGNFACHADGDALVIADRRLEFPRQIGGEGLCLADYFRQDGDAVALQAVTVGARAGDYVDELQRSGQYARMLYVNGLASASAEALAEWAHQVARRELGVSAQQGLRFSWGYAACPDLHEQRKVLPLLQAEDRIGLRLTESDMLDPEHSTVAMVVHHPEAKYFSMR